MSVFMALSTVFLSINSPNNSPLSHSVLPALFLPYWSFQVYISLWKSPSALIESFVVDWAWSNFFFLPSSGQEEEHGQPVKCAQTLGSNWSQAKNRSSHWVAKFDHNWAVCWLVDRDWTQDDRLVYSKHNQVKTASSVCNVLCVYIFELIDQWGDTKVQYHFQIFIAIKAPVHYQTQSYDWADTRTDLQYAISLVRSTELPEQMIGSYDRVRE